MKNELRKTFLNLLRNQSDEERLKKSDQILKKLFLSEEFKKAEIILFYASFDGEVDTYSMMKESKRLGKQIALPIILKDQKGILPTLIEDLESDLVEGTYGIKCPNLKKTNAVSKDSLDLILVPGVVFDKGNNRLGRGKGYYDRFLSQLSSNIPTFGLAFDFQIIEQIPSLEIHDVRVSRVISN